MRYLILTIVLGLTALTGMGYLRSHKAAAQAENLARLEPIVGELLDGPLATTTAATGVGDLDAGGNTAADGSMIVDSGAAVDGLGYGSSAGGMGMHGRVESNADGQLEEGVEWVDFDRLAMPDYAGEPTFDDEPRPAREEIFPADILALDGQRIALDGFMMPLDFKERKVTAFILSPYPPGCHFGGMPRLDEWVDSTVTNPDGVEWLAYRAIRVIGTLEIGEQIDDYGYVTSIYRMAAERVEQLW